MDGELVLQEGWLCVGLALQGNAVQARAGQSLQVQARAYIHCCFTEEVERQPKILKFHALALSKMFTYCVSWHPKNA